MNTPSLLKGMPYTPSDRTDVTKTWARFGWKPVHNEKPEHDFSLLDDYALTDRLGYLENVGAWQK